MIDDGASLMSATTIGELLEPEPRQWGLRGDPYLWRDMRDHLSKTPLPETVDALRDELEKAFLLLSGRAISTADDFRVERFAHGGMSSGFICAAFWRERALPLLTERFLAR
jgi:hypothetical protein